MLVYSSEKFIRAHEDRGNQYRNHSWDRFVKDAICSSCGKIIGEQARYPDFDKKFHYVDSEKREWKYCPICGEKLY